MSDAGLIGGAGNQFIIDFLNSHNIHHVESQYDVLEIGAFTGATTRHLALWCQEHSSVRRVVVVDPMKPEQDPGRETLYREWLNGRNQLDLFYENIKGLDNVSLWAGSSQEFWAREPKGLMRCAIIIDGGHEYEVVKQDLQEGWAHLAPDGVMLVHDYGHDIPDVTRACDEFRTLAGNGGMTVEVLPQFVMIAFIKAANHVG